MIEKEKPHPQKENHPKKGVSNSVDPIRDEEDIKTLIKFLDGDSRNSLLFILGINTGIRSTDILKLRVGDLKYLKPGQVYQIIEGKTGKRNVIVINKSIRKALDKFITDQSPDDRDFLFQSKKRDTQGQPQPISVGSVNRLVKTWTKAINLKTGNYGARTLRKTWGYQQRVKFGVGFEVIAKRYNHSSPAVTMRYLGIEDKEVHNVLMNEIG